MVNEFERVGCKVVLMKYPRSISKLQLLINLVKYFSKEKTGIVHVQYIAPAAIVILAARFAGVRNVFATVHQMGDPYGWKEHLLLRMSSRLCNRFTFVSLAAQKSWLGTKYLFNSAVPGTYKKRVGTIYNTIDIEEVDQIVEKTDKDALKKQFGIEQKLIIGAVSRLRYEKGIDILLKAFGLLVPKYPLIHLLIVGDGPDKSELISMTRESGITYKITWMGELTHTEALSIMTIMDIVVLSSRHEGFGLSALEAMAIGIPIIATKSGGLEEVIEEGISGLLVPVEDINRLSSAIEEIINDPGKRNILRNAGQLRVRTVFSMHNFVKQIQFLYQKC
jgi:glycosyltransferase involved in cell wall biosynthesis